MAIVIALSSLLAGCGSNVEGSAVAGERWDPCSIPDTAIDAAGLDSSTKEQGWGSGIQVDDWGLCTYKSDAYYFTVKSSFTRTVEDARANSSNIDGTDVGFGERDGYLYRTNVGESGRTCNVAIELPPGVVVFSVIDMSNLSGDQLCGLVARVSKQLEQALPELN